MIKHIAYFIILYFILFFIKYIIILQDNKINRYSINQYEKTKKKYVLRGRIFDREKKIIQYSSFIQNNKKKIVYKRQYLSIPSTTLTGIVNFENQGISGLEQYYNNILEKTTIVEYEKKLFLGDSFIKKNHPQHGTDLYTTINTNLTEYCYLQLQEHVNHWQSKYSSIIIMDGKDGSIETLTQYPQYSAQNDNIDFIYPMAINCSYEMGSIIKIFLMAAALQEKIVTKDTKINCYGVKEKKIQGIPLTTWKAHGTIPFWQVIQESNNFGVSQIGLQLQEKLYDYYRNFGFGEKLEIPFQAQSQGFISHPRTWSKRTPLSLSFGYEMRCSLLQLVSAITIFIHDGKRVLPRFLIDQKTQYIDSLCKEQAAQAGKDIIAISNEKLKLLNAQISKECTLYGKTGTANIIIDGIYDKDKNTYVFVGFIQYKGEIKVIGLYTYLSNTSSVYSSNVSLPTVSKIINYICHEIDRKENKEYL